MVGYPKPKKTEKARKAKPKRTNAYMRPEWRKLVREVRKRSKGICECCSNPVDGDPHHLRYAEFKGWRRLIVPIDDLLDLCHGCHVQFEMLKFLTPSQEQR